MANDFDDTKEEAKEGANKLGEAGKDAWETTKNKARNLADNKDENKGNDDKDKEDDNANGDDSDYLGESEDEEE